MMLFLSIISHQGKNVQKTFQGHIAITFHVSQRKNAFQFECPINFPHCQLYK